MSSLFVFIAILFLASCSLGGAWQSIDATSEYLKDRAAFGEPLANFQVININFIINFSASRSNNNYYNNYRHFSLSQSCIYVDCFSQCLGLVVDFLQIIS